MKISIVTGFRNRDSLRVSRYLESLENQINKDFELIFVDYGSDLKISEKIKNLTSQFSFCKYIYNDTRGWPWNRSHALNTGLKISKGEYVLFSDIDLIYSNNFIDYLIKESNPLYQYFKRFYLMPESFGDFNNNLEKHTQQFSLSAINTKGAIHLVERKKLIEINGFDEFYCFWGFEDLDLYLRLKNLGIQEKWLEESVAPVFHQWHPIVSNENRYLFPNKWYEQMLIYFRLNINNSIRNNRSWGGVINAKDRLINNKSQEVHLEIPKQILLNSKTKFITNLIETLKNLKENQYIYLEVPLPKQPKKYLKKRFLSFYTKITSLFYSNQVIINDGYVKYLEREVIENKAILLPEEDIYFVLWTLIKFHNVVNDYSISIDENKQIFKLC
ncbi:glycosyltransferase family 2 protein [Formosa sp. L2A11]|uniref:glycosyltransferase family 2 protein n=1 Tax=Formosa sp. L2A11 TaxID=2686363 RepID=UPI00131DD970|nr:glycosyltransferase [Formosa sp. L2A11]